MAQVFNGGQITVDDEEDIIPVEYDDSGVVKAVGRTTFFFTLISGSIQTSVGKALDESPATQNEWSTAGDKWFHTASPSLDKSIAEGFYGNIRGVGSSGVVTVFW